jgi:hypothetical protein
MSNAQFWIAVPDLPRRNNQIHALENVEPACGDIVGGFSKEFVLSAKSVSKKFFFGFLFGIFSIVPGMHFL